MITRTTSALALLSLLAFAAAVLSLRQSASSAYAPEADSCIPAAVSYVAHGAPLGLIYPNVESTFRDHTAGTSVQTHVAAAARPTFPVGHPPHISDDGNGVGCPLFASIAMRVFGLQLSSLTYGFLSLLGLSVAAFLVRYGDERVLAAPLLLSALTAMLLTPLATSKFAVDQTPVGAIRYFVIAGILPALHAYLEMTEPEGSRTRINKSHLMLLGLQVFILAIAILVRNAAGYLVGPPIAAAILAIHGGRANPARLRGVLLKVGVAAATFALFVAVIVASTPSRYWGTGRAFGLVWHRAVVGYGVNPAWPFPGVRNAYRCERAIPEGIVPGLIDRNGHCIWFAYGLRHGRSIAELINELYGTRYEAAMRTAFFNVIRLDPRDALETFLYYKPRAILQTALSAFRFTVSHTNYVVAILALLQFAILTLSWVSIAGGSSLHVPRALGKPLLLFSLCSLPLYFAAWPLLWDDPDMALYEFSVLLLVLGAAVEYGVRRLRPKGTRLAIVHVQNAGATGQPNSND